MALEIISRFLWRAPLLPVADLARAPRDIFADELPSLALRLAQPSLARVATQARPAAEVARALSGFARRAAFRATPHGLWAGAGVGVLAKRTRVATGPLRAEVTVAFARLARLARARLDDEAWRARAKLRVAPSLLSDGARVMWLAMGQGASAVAREAELDETLAQLLAAAQRWTPFAELAALANEELLLLLVDDGLLLSDLSPALVGPPPLAQAAARDPDLASVVAALADQDVDAARARLAELPGDGEGEALHAVLVHEGEATLSRAAVERAARLAPLLFRVQEGLAPPAAERALDGATATALAGVTEVFGAGAFALGPLALGAWGTRLDIAVDDERPPPDARLAAYLADAAVAAARAGSAVAALDPAVLDALAPPLPTPPTFELMVTPMREPPRARPGTGWLVGLHAPAGATWGRFAHALGAPLAAAFAELTAVEPPGSCDVAYAPSPELADLCAHPPLRSSALALSSWPDVGTSRAPSSVAPSALALAADAALPEPLALASDGAPLLPSPAWRVRSSTAPRGPYRLLAGFTLVRQHAPWALPLGPLAELAWTPRFTVDDFVVAAASWRIPPLPDRRALLAWRRGLNVPPQLQIGHGDELLLVDLDAPEALAQLARLPPADSGDRPRAWEVWPPLDRLVDAGGRRVEAVIAVVDRDPEREAARLFAAQSGTVPSPDASRAPEWLTCKLYGPPDRAELVLAEVVAPLVRELGRDGLLDGWFFLPYVDGPGRRDHLRLRLATRDPRHALARLDALVAPLRRDGTLATVEHADYHRELARYGADAMPAVERVFQADSELVLALLDARDDELDPPAALVQSYDALAAGAGLDLAARAALARRRRDAFDLPRAPSGSDDPLAGEFRRRQSRLRSLVARRPATFAAHTHSVARAFSDLPISRRQELLPALLHLAAVRLGGPDGALEAAAVYLWQRTLESLLRHAEKP